MPDVNHLGTALVSNLDTDSITPIKGSIGRAKSGEGVKVAAPSHRIDFDFRDFNQKKKAPSTRKGRMTSPENKDSVSTSYYKR